MITTLVLFIIGGSGQPEVVNVGLAVLLGLAFGGAMYVTARAVRPPRD
jgi:hypothetical protein